MNGSSGIMGLKWAKLADQVVDLNKSIYVGIPSPLLELLIGVNLNV